MIYVVLWLAGAAAILVQDPEKPWSAAVAATTLLYVLVRYVRHRRSLRRLRTELAERFGGTGRDLMETGRMLGGGGVTGLLGAVVGGIANAFTERKLSAEEVELRDRIRQLERWSPFHSIWVMMVGWAMCGGARWVVEVIQQAP